MSQSNRRPNTLRWAGRDYTLPGAYFVTLCSHGRTCLFADVVGGQVHLKPAGEILRDTWMALPGVYGGVQLDGFCVMPDHVHGIIMLGTVDAQGDQSPTLGDVIRGYKARCSRRIRELSASPDQKIWQRNYFEHIIRSTASLEHIRQYIADNPRRWSRA